MTLLADAAIRSGLVVLIGLALAGLLRYRSAAVRHAMLTTALCAAAVVPALGLMLPAWTPSIPQAISVSVEPVRDAPLPASAPEGDGHRPAGTSAALPLLAIAWAAGSIACGMLLLTGIARLLWITWHAERLADGRWVRLAAQVSTAYGLRRRPTVLVTRERGMLATWGVLRPCVLLPAGARAWSDDRVRIVLCHELAHVRRRDWILQIAADLLRIVYWFNPLLWVACARLRRESEQACDDMVLAAGVPARQYAGQLLAIARCGRAPAPIWSTAVRMSRPSTLERRIAAMLDPQIRRTVPSRRTLAVTAAALFILTLPIAAVRVPQEGPLPLAGSVYDATGAVMPDVDLTLEGGKVTLRATTDAAGQFEFPTVEPGHYTLQARLPGFRQLRQDIDLRTARDWERAITLQVGDVKETIVVTERRIAGSAPPAAGPVPVRVGGNVRPPRKLHDVRPVYPAAMREAGREGTVPIEAIIGRDGAVHVVRVLSAQIHPDFALAAADAVRQWRFEPTLLNGVPVEVVMTVSVEFSLSD